LPPCSRQQRRLLKRPCGDQNKQGSKPHQTVRPLQRPMWDLHACALHGPRAHTNILDRDSPFYRRPLNSGLVVVVVQCHSVFIKPLLDFQHFKSYPTRLASRTHFWSFECFPAFGRRSRVDHIPVPSVLLVRFSSNAPPPAPQQHQNAIAFKPESMLVSLTECTSPWLPFSIDLM
jgi:hypothetical protein